jgi:hypothetical protein
MLHSIPASADSSTWRLDRCLNNAPQNPREAVAWLYEATPDATLLASRWGMK